MIPTVVFSSLLIAVALGLLWLHRRSWHAVRKLELDPEDLQFARRQYARRAQISGLIVAVALAMLAGHWVRQPWAALALWGGVTLLVLWICLLAALDWMHTRWYYDRLRDRNVAERAALESEMRRVWRHRSNGKPGRS